ncbi:hypothetical protein AJOOGB_AJOOGB_12360, partial [Dysosmobacter welbionis]
EQLEAVLQAHGDWRPAAGGAGVAAGGPQGPGGPCRRAGGPGVGSGPHLRH